MLQTTVPTLDVVVTDEAASRLRSLLVEEDGDAVVRIREPESFTVYCRWDILVLSIDEREDDDVEGETRAIPFAVEKELVDRYGGAFFIGLDDTGALAVGVGNNADALRQE